MLRVASAFVLVLGACTAPPPMDMTPPQPTAEHQMLQKGVGTWEGTLTMYMPDVPATPIPAKEVVEPIGPYWTQSRFTCDFMGMPFMGTGAMGYDTVKERYVGTWIDNMTTELAVMTGEMEADGTLVMRFTARDPATGDPTPHRIETTFADNSYVSTFFHGTGSGTKAMVIEMKRVGGPK